MAAGYAAEGSLHPLSNPTSYGVNIQDNGGLVNTITFTNTPFNRASVAIKEVFAQDPKKFTSALSRLMAAADFIKKYPEVANQHYQEEEEMYCEMSRPLLEAFAALPLSNELQFNKDQLSEFLASKT